MSLKEGHMRTDMETSRGTMSAIFDMKAQQIMILMPQQRMYMVQNMPQPAAGQPPARMGSAPGNLQNTGVKETILGYECTKYTVTGADGSMTDIWVTDQLGTFIGLFHGGPGGRSQPPAEWESALKGGNFFPMRVVSNSSRGTFKLEVTAVNKASLPDSVFAAPEGWQKFDLGSIMGGGMHGGFQVGPPPGGNN
jgi:hypothetical protein